MYMRSILLLSVDAKSFRTSRLSPRIKELKCGIDLEDSVSFSVVVRWVLWCQILG